MEGSSFTQALHDWSLGNDEAFAVMALFNRLGHTADDFVDGDVSEEDASDRMLSLLELCLIRLPSIPFYIRNVISYQTVMLQIFLLYDESNKLVKEKDESLFCLSFAFRGSEELLYYHTAYLLGGLDHANKVRREYREWWKNTDTYEEWKKEHIDGFLES